MSSGFSSEWELFLIHLLRYNESSFENFSSKRFIATKNEKCSRFEKSKRKSILVDFCVSFGLFIDANVLLLLQLFVDYGLMKPLDKGTYYYLPILQRSINKTNALVRRFMHKIDAQEISIPNLTPVELWTQSGEYRNFWKLEFCKQKLTKAHSLRIVLQMTYLSYATRC